MTKNKPKSRVISFYTYPEISEDRLRQYGGDSVNSLARRLLINAEVDIKEIDKFSVIKYKYLLNKSKEINQLTKACNIKMKFDGRLNSSEVRDLLLYLRNFKLDIEGEMSFFKFKLSSLTSNSINESDNKKELLETRKRMGEKEQLDMGVLRTKLVCFRLPESSVDSLSAQLAGHASVGQFARDIFENDCPIRYTSNSFMCKEVLLISKLMNNLNQLTQLTEDLRLIKAIINLDVYYQLLSNLRDIEWIYKANLSSPIFKLVSADKEYVDDRSERYEDFLKQKQQNNQVK
ncbi:hypothetical protein CTH30272_03087 [Allocatenococcus thiocycli]|nr:hypothetical protein CTH30272_03087 [Catenococcus thiocycli]